MPPKKKKFIDKKKAVTFHLVHRSQKDPLIASEDAPERVLLPIEEKSKIRKEEERKFGVFFEDGYDYMQHLRDVNEINDVEMGEGYASFEPKQRNDQQQKNINLPSSVFGSEMETDEGLLNKAAPLRGPQLDWDPDIVAALDEDFNFDDPDNVLEDDFIVHANAKDSDEDDDSDGEYEDEEVSSDGGNCRSEEDEFSDGEHSFGDFETKSRFTNYSMTSSVIKRNEGLTLLDDRFEKVFEEYDDDEIGPLDQDDIQGNLQQSSQLLDNILNEFEAQQKQVTLKDTVQKSTEPVVLVESGSDDSDLEKMVVEQPKEKWDCESILSTYSTLYNHPTKIVVPKSNATKQRNHKTSESTDRGLSLKEIEKEYRSSRNCDKATTYRPKDESAEERKARKKQIKEERKERRVEKKATKIAFKQEKIKQDKELINVQKNLQGMRMS